MAHSFTAADRSEIEKAKNSIKAKRHVATPDKVISDLSFGFWVSLLNVPCFGWGLTFANGTCSVSRSSDG
ncbi:MULTISPECIES: hypothetical protein [unclassified Pseudomonas]|uniref:hypothetical protein n=1 Tax=unclassified Pseudomonas TaxID=196821 RepID=UPI00380222B2